MMKIKTQLSYSELEVIEAEAKNITIL